MVQERFRDEKNKASDIKPPIKTKVVKVKPYQIIGKKPLPPMNLEEFIQQYENPVKTLRLTLTKEWFDLEKTGEKKFEFRRPSEWVKSRLIDKDGNPRHYDYVEYKNGYAPNSPMLVVKYNGFFISDETCWVQFGQSTKILVREGDFVIKNGDIISVRQ